MIIGIIAVLLMVLVSGAAGQETEPVLMCDPAEDIQVRWHEAGDWITVPAISAEIVPGPIVPSTRRMISAGIQRWYSATPDSTDAVPMKFSIRVDIASPAGSWLFAVMRLRTRCRLRMPDGSEPDKVGDWSNPSGKRFIVDLQWLRAGKPESH